jgi:hypothetical protein
VTSEEHGQHWQKPKVSGPPPLRNKAADLFSAVVLIAGTLFAAYWYFPSQLLSFRHDHLESTGSIAPSQLSAESAKHLLDQSLAGQPVVIRVPLGDVVTVSTGGEINAVWPKLADAQLIRLRFCHFPGAGGPGKEVCVADLTDKGKKLATSAIPSMAISLGPDTLAANQTYAQFTVGVPQVTEVEAFSTNEPGQVTLSYQAAVESTGVADAVMGKDQFPSRAAGRATIRRIGSAWQVAQNELQPQAAK